MLRVIPRDYKGDPDIKLGPLEIRRNERDIDGYGLTSGYAWILNFNAWRIHIFLGIAK